MKIENLLSIYLKEMLISDIYYQTKLVAAIHCAFGGRWLIIACFHKLLVWCFQGRNRKGYDLVDSKLQLSYR